MKIELINYSNNLQVGNIGAAICVNKHHQASINNLLSAIESGHFSVLEHISFSFLIEDVTRSLTHQLVRHRIASYSQKSDRYSKINSDIKWYFIPPSIARNSLATTLYTHAMNTSSDIYQELLDLNIPKEDARMTMPDGRYTSILMTMNARALIEFMTKRYCFKAQHEIFKLAHLIKQELIHLSKLKGGEDGEVIDLIISLCVPNCISSTCKEKKPCKNPKFTEKKLFICKTCGVLAVEKNEKKNMCEECIASINKQNI